MKSMIDNLTQEMRIIRKSEKKFKSSMINEEFKLIFSIPKIHFS